VLSVGRGEERPDLIERQEARHRLRTSAASTSSMGFAPIQSPARVASLNMRWVMARRWLRVRGFRTSAFDLRS
jgi:hypothetical protein